MAKLSEKQIKALKRGRVLYYIKGMRGICNILIRQFFDYMTEPERANVIELRSALHKIILNYYKNSVRLGVYT